MVVRGERRVDVILSVLKERVPRVVPPGRSVNQVTAQLFVGVRVAGMVS